MMRVSLIFIYFLLHQLNVLGQNIYFDCRQSIIRDVVQRDVLNIQEFLATEYNRDVLRPPIQGSATISTQLPKMDSDSYWQLTADTNDMSLDFTRLMTGTTAFVITGIAIQTVLANECPKESSINAESFRFSYGVDGREFEITDVKGSATNMDQSLPITFRTNIDPITAQNLTIHKTIGTGMNCVRYEVFGCPLMSKSIPLLQVPILQYDLSRTPLQYSNGGYTGMCRDGKCVGGVGKLVDGNIGRISDLNLGVSGLFTVWTGESVTITLKLSKYIDISEVNILCAELPTNSFNTSGELITQSVTIQTKSYPINSLVNKIALNLSSNANMTIAVSEIEVLGRNGGNIQDYFQTLYQPQFCSSQTANSVEMTEKSELQNTILIITVVILSLLLFIMGISIITLICVVTYNNYRPKRVIDEMIDAKMHESTMNVAKNRLATYAEVNEVDIAGIRKKLRQQMLTDQDVGPKSPKNSKEKTHLISNNSSNTQLFSFSEAEHTNPMYPKMTSQDESGDQDSSK